MRLKAPVAAVGATLAGGVSYADEPVTIAFVDGAYEIGFTASGTRVTVADDRLSAVWNDKDKMPEGGDGPADLAMFRLDAGGAEAASSSRFVIDGLDKACTIAAAGVGETLVVDVRACSYEVHVDDKTLNIRDRIVLADDQVTVRDCGSDGVVRVTPDGFTVEIAGHGVVSQAFETSVVGLPSHLGLSVVDPSGQGALFLAGVEVPALTVRGRTNGSRAIGLRIEDMVVEGDHLGVGVRSSVIDHLFVDGRFTGSAIKTVVSDYDGPTSFHVAQPLVKSGN